MKNQVLVPAASGVDALAKTPGYPVLTAFKIARLNVALRKAVQPFEEARTQLISEHIDPATGQWKLTEVEGSDQKSPIPTQMKFNKAIQDLMEQDVPFTLPDDLRLSWNDIANNSAAVAPSRLENLYRNGFIVDKPDFSGVAKKTITGLNLGKLMNLSTALFLVANTAMPLNSLLTAILIENLSRIVPLGEAALKAEAQESDETVELLALDVSQLEQLTPPPTGEVLSELMELM